MSSDIDYPEGVPADIWDQEIQGEMLVLALYSQVRRRFRELEKSEGLTQTALAERMGLSRAQISRWFVNPSNMTLRTAGRLLCAMGRSLDLRLCDPYKPLTAEEISEREQYRAQHAAKYRDEVYEVEGELVRMSVRIEDPSNTAE